MVDNITLLAKGGKPRLKVAPNVSKMFGTYLKNSRYVF